MLSEEGVISLPLRLAVSMLIVSLALPVCIQSLSDGERELARDAAVRMSEEISRAAEEVSSKPVGESRLITFRDFADMGRYSISLTAGSFLGEEDFSRIRCDDATGWAILIQVDLSPIIVGFCSFDLRPFSLGACSGDILISHGKHPCGEIIQVGFA